jgi:HAD superfamily hydrolase (TIGR01484 family)
VFDTLVKRYIGYSSNENRIGLGSFVEITKHVPSLDFHDDPSVRQVKSNDNVTTRIPVKLLVLDYDGTISSLNVARTISRVPEKTREVLQRIGRSIPIAIVTTKDLSFIMPRTTFAHAWSGVSGLEAKIDRKILRKNGDIRRLKRVSLALEYARSRLTGYGIEIEEKRDMKRRTIAFCVDWRRAQDTEKATNEANKVAVYCEELSLKVVGFGRQPFFDVYPLPVDKGGALEEMLRELNSKNGVLYMGDSEADNPAFERSDVGVGVIHKESCPEKLACDYFVKFEDVSPFLGRLLANHFLFDSGFPMIRRNFEKVRQQCTKE